MYIESSFSDEALLHVTGTILTIIDKFPPDSSRILPIFATKEFANSIRSKMLSCEVYQLVEGLEPASYLLFLDNLLLSLQIFFFSGSAIMYPILVEGILDVNDFTMKILTSHNLPLKTGILYFQAHIFSEFDNWVRRSRTV